MKYYVVDAFSEHIFGGNPAGVCVLEQPMENSLMQQISMENNLSETAFLYKMDSGTYDLKWFTPKAEIDLCGHATLAAAFVASNFVEPGVKIMRFLTRSGFLEVVRKEEYYTMNFPSRMPFPVESFALLSQAIGAEGREVYLARDYMVVLDTQEQVETLHPDFTALQSLPKGLGVIVTAPARDQGIDFVSRCFYPKLGVPEDPVTGSAHRNLIPYWATRLGKLYLTARQLSQRGGILFCEDCGQRVTIGGQAVLYLQGEILV